MDREDISSPDRGTTSHEGFPSREEVREAGEQVAGTVKQEYGKLRDDAVHATHEAMEAGKHQARAYTERQRQRAAGHIAAVARAMQDSVASLEAQGETAMAAYWQRAADEAEGVARWAEEKSLGEMWQAAERYAREHPGVAFGGAVAAGFVLARVFASSAPRNRP